MSLHRSSASFCALLESAAATRKKLATSRSVAPKWAITCTPSCKVKHRAPYGQLGLRVARSRRRLDLLFLEFPRFWRLKPGTSGFRGACSIPGSKASVLSITDPGTEHRHRSGQRVSSSWLLGEEADRESLLEGECGATGRGGLGAEAIYPISPLNLSKTPLLVPLLKSASLSQSTPFPGPSTPIYRSMKAGPLHCF